MFGLKYRKQLFTLLLISLTSLSACGSKDASDGTVSDSPVESGTASDSSSITDEMTISPSVISEYEENTTPSESAVYVSLDNCSGVYEIKDDGDYVLSGTLNNGRIVINASGKVHLFLDNISISSDDGASICSFSDSKTVLTLCDNTVNTLKDNSSYNTFYNDDNDEPNGCIFSHKALTINGSGTLNITASGSFETSSKTKYACGIISKDELKILGTPTINISSVGNGIKGKDFTEIRGGQINISADNDGIKSDKYVYIDDGEINVTKSEEGIEAEIICINGGSTTLTSSDDGLNASSDTDESTCLIEIHDGILNINAYGDGIDSNGNILMTGGKVFTDGPISGGDGSLDYGDNNNYMHISGGTLLCIGSYGMAENPSSSSTQQFASFIYSGNINENDIVSIRSDENIVFSSSVLKTRSGKSVIQVSFPEMDKDTNYTFFINDESVEFSGSSLEGSMSFGRGDGFGGNGGGFPGMSGDNNLGFPDKGNDKVRPETPGGENGMTPPDMPDGDDGMTPPDMPDGDNGMTPPDMPDSQNQGNV